METREDENLKTKKKEKSSWRKQSEQWVVSGEHHLLPFHRLFVQGLEGPTCETRLAFGRMTRASAGLGGSRL